MDEETTTMTARRVSLFAVEQLVPNNANDNTVAVPMAAVEQLATLSEAGSSGAVKLYDDSAAQHDEHTHTADDAEGQHADDGAERPVASTFKRPVRLSSTAGISSAATTADASKRMRSDGE